MERRSERFRRGLFKRQLEIVELELTTQMIGRPPCPGQDEAAHCERDAGDDGGMGVPGRGFVMTKGSVDGIQNEDTSRGDKHTSGENGIAEIKMCPADGAYLFIMKTQAIYEHGVVLHPGDRTIKPLTIDSLHVQCIPYCVCMDQRTSFFQDEQISLR